MPNKILILLINLSFICIVIPIKAEVPGTMNYQGLLTDHTGNPVSDGSYSVIFRIYDDIDIARWEETHQIATKGGLFSVQLGSNGSPLTADTFGHPDRWLGITIGTDPEMTPRTRLSTVPYAFKTGTVPAEDILNEPGVAAYSGAFYVYLTNMDYTVLCSLQIDCPAAGYVMAIAHGRIAALPQHIYGTRSYAIVGISDTPNSLPGNQDLDFQIDSAAPTGIYSFPFGMTSMFEVPAAGVYTYYYLAYEYSGSVSVADMQFNLVYFPTAYGNVDPVPPPPVRSYKDGSSNLPEDFAEAAADTWQLKPDALSVTGLERELAAMKARIEVMQQQLDNMWLQEP